VECLFIHENLCNLSDKKAQAKPMKKEILSDGNVNVDPVAPISYFLGESLSLDMND